MDAIEKWRVAEDARRKADKALDEALRRRIAAGHGEVKAVLQRMLEFVPDVGFPKNVTPAYYSGPTIPGKGGGLPERVKAYRMANDLEASDLPFFSETYLYELLGKEDARTILAYLGALARAIGREGLGDLEEAVRSGPFRILVAFRIRERARILNALARIIGRAAEALSALGDAVKRCESCGRNPSTGEPCVGRRSKP